MAYLLGVDTGGTYTDAVVIDEAADRVIASAKSLTTRPDLALGVGRAIDAAIAEAGVAPSQIAMVSLSTTLATNALVEGQGGRVALVEFRAEDSSVPIKALHKMSEAQARRELEAAGLSWIGTDARLPWQHLLWFRK